MTITYKILGQTRPTAETQSNIYTVPAGSSAVVSTVNICNQQASSDNFRIAVVPSGETLSAEHYISYNVIVPAYDSIALTIGITLSAGDQISAYSNSGNISFNIFGSEVN